MDSEGSKVKKKIVEIDESAVKNFFISRAVKYDPAHPEVSMLYQDSNPALAEERDQEEKNIILPLINLQAVDKVLDVGCGIGRWAEIFAPLVARYVGTDVMLELIEIAEQRNKEFPNVAFKVIAAQDFSLKKLGAESPFSVIIVAGVLHYMNDESVAAVLRNIGECADHRARIIIRGPIALEERLTLNNVWSEELQHEYSAIYRTRGEFLDLFAKFLFDFEITADQPLFPSRLNNRKETMQHLFLLEKK